MPRPFVPIGHVIAFSVTLVALQSAVSSSAPAQTATTQLVQRAATAMGGAARQAQ